MRERQMKPKFNSTRLLGVTRSKEKMYEFQIPDEYHINPYKDGNPEDLFYLTIGILGDFAAFLNDGEKMSDDDFSNLLFAAKFFDSFIGARFNNYLDTKLKLLSAAAYYLINRPGSSLVMANKILPNEISNIFEFTLWQILSNRYDDRSELINYRLEKLLKNRILDIKIYLNNGIYIENLEEKLNELRRLVYENGTPEELLLVDLIVAVYFQKINNSSWNKLPIFSNLPVDMWKEIIKKKDFPKELWPSQIKIGEAGLFDNTSGVIQMPTSAGKTKSIEIVLHSAFLGKRTKLAIVVAPFRALCNEITYSLKNAFNDTDVKVNEISDALQLDFIESISELLGTEYSSLNYVLILTPEKLLYVLRQLPSLINHLGLLIYDEGHQFDSGKRGITYELLLSEINSLLPKSTQIILISAVIQNAQDISNWLIGTDGQIVDGTKLLASSKSVAFASWLEGRGGELYFKEDFPYFVPRIFTEKKLDRLNRERVDRTFPERNTNTDIALDLAIRLVPQGPVAIYSGLKSSALNIIKRAVDIYQRNLDVLPPVSYSVSEEIYCLYSLICKHFGETSHLAKGAQYGFFLHHGTTPNGLRLCIEYAMQKHLIKFISCTSTLAQGVNLPIRYLIVTSMSLAGEKIKVRDFQNLIGRAGRSSMHTEGLIIFADPTVYDSTDKYKYNNALSLLDSENTEAVSSSLLKIIQPIVTSKRYKGSFWQIPMPIKLLISDDETCLDWINETLTKFSHLYTEDDLKNAIFGRKKLVNTIESYLMANRQDNSDEDFISESEELAKKTLAYSLASDTEQLGLIELFREIAFHIIDSISDPLVQREFSKTLLGIRETKIIYDWVEDHKKELNSTGDKYKFLELIWPLILSLLDDKFLHSSTPDYLALEIVKLWIDGVSYHDIFEYVVSESGQLPHGQGSRKINEDAILNFLEQTLSFEVGLLLGAIATFLSPGGMEDDHFIFEFQKLIKYGLPDSNCAFVYELGLSDRVIAQEVVNLIRTDDLNFPVEFVFKRNSFKTYKKIFKRYFQQYPAYFQNVINTL